MDSGQSPEVAAVILYGRSLLLDSVEMKLRQDGRIPILRLSHTRVPPQLDNVPPGMIIYDGDQVDGAAVYQLLTDYPGWQLVGLTASEEKVLIINSERGDGRSLADLMKMIQG
ncbi:MAG: hypothetical protein ACE5EY_01120 [Anaerolineae bacterium]